VKIPKRGLREMGDQDALVPNPLVTDKEYRRFYHVNLCGLEYEELTDELHYLRPLLWGLDSIHLLRERVFPNEKISDLGRENKARIVILQK